MSAIEKISPTIYSLSATKINELGKSITDYSRLLNMYNANEYSSSGYYWQVGEIEKTQGWIIHLSVVKIQLLELFNRIIPELIKTKMPFKVAKDINTAGALVEGSLGYINLGKIICIYPGDDQKAAIIAKNLIDLTKPYRGPAIPTDLHLGSIVYTRYGSFNPIILDNAGTDPIKYIYNTKGELIPDTYSVPFTLPADISWPFSEIASPIILPKSKLLNYRYYPISIIKPDAKGKVIKALYFKHLFLVKSCLIKEGRQYMASDDAGRDIKDRLEWQFNLYHALKGIVPMPKVFDYFEENGDGYLAMEFIKGISLTSWINILYQNSRWLDLPLSHKQKLLDKLMEIFSIIKRLHEENFIHRDITPENFIIDKKNNPFLIDMELTWSSTQIRPNPPFRLGTDGYMSPEQGRAQTPTFKEDIYALGALMLSFLTNLSPIKFSQQPLDTLKSNLNFFTGDPIISELIADCLQIDATKRPELSTIQYKVEEFSKNQKLRAIENDYDEAIKQLLPQEITDLLHDALVGLVNFQLLSPKHRWLSKLQRKEDQIGNEQIELALYEGWHTGMTGPLWLISRAKLAGFPIEACETAYFNSWDYIKKHYLKNTAASGGGLFAGGAGIAMALAEGLDSQLVSFDGEICEYMNICFVHPITELALSDGLAGQGISLLNCAPKLKYAEVKYLLVQCIDKIIAKQQVDGSWNLMANSGKKRDILLGLDNGIAGIIWFLLHFLEYEPEAKVKVAAIKALDWVIRKAHKNGNQYIWHTSTKTRAIDLWSSSKGIPGISLCFIKAYQVLKNPVYKDIAEGSLKNIPDRPVIMDYTYAEGLAGLGEIYLEAFKVLKDNIWKDRADWIAQLFLHSFQAIGENQKLWMAGGTNIPTADLFYGNGGIIHYLMRYLAPNKLSHPLSISIKPSSD